LDGAILSASYSLQVLLEASLLSRMCVWDMVLLVWCFGWYL
jgi:hypothetical protein